MFDFFIRKGLGALAALAITVGANPALANSSATADIAAPLRAAQAEKPTALGNRDDQFKALFSRWQSLDGSTTAKSSVSIPSRMPVEGVRLSSDYGTRIHPVLGGRRGHKGIDLAGPTGTPIYATADGIVSRADWFSSYGLYVSLEHGGSLQTRYGHMSRLNVAAGQRVRKGEIIGYVGSTGRSTGPHLHYEVRIAGAAVNPVPYLNAGTHQLALASADSSLGQGGPIEK
ncbi:MAG: M23 family metallopeptidase [Novosphingobium sp.]|nr:M23 family metallopeptidase [Novosphingobium sp.]